MNVTAQPLTKDDGPLSPWWIRGILIVMAIGFSDIEKYVKVCFWGTNIGLAMMVSMSLFPAGVLQVWDVVQNGYWHARSLDYIGSDRSHFVEWLRLPGDLVFILLGSLPLVIAAVKGYLGARGITGVGLRKIPDD